MNKKYLIIVGVILSMAIIIFMSINVVQSLRMKEDIDGYLDSHFSRRNEEEFYKVDDSPYYLYAGYQLNTEFPVIYIYHYTDNDLSICSTSLLTHDGYIDKGDYMIDNGKCKDYVLFGQTGISYIILKYEKDITINYSVDDNTVRVEEITYFDDVDFIVFYYYGKLDDNKSVIVDGETIFLN